MSRTSRVGSAFLAGLGLVGCTTLPTPAEMLATGYRSPEQCFRTFQCAVRADEPLMEYRCFSDNFRSEKHVSQWAWREIREQLWTQVGMRWAVAKAKASAPARVSGNRAWMEVSALGKHVRLQFVREEAGQLWNGETLLSDDALDFHSHTGAQEGGLFYGQVPMPPDLEPAKVTEMHLGQEWKLDEIDLDGGS
jgi:hypothetical protein